MSCPAYGNWNPLPARHRAQLLSVDLGTSPPTYHYWDPISRTCWSERMGIRRWTDKEPA